MNGRKDDRAKPMYHLIPAWALEQVARVLTYGATKYAPDNWRKVPDGAQRYTSALMRHLEAWRQGEATDQDSGLPHLAQVATNALFLLELERLFLLVEEGRRLRAISEPHPQPTNRGPSWTPQGDPRPNHGPYRSPPEDLGVPTMAPPFDTAAGEHLDALGHMFGFSERPKDPMGKPFSDTEFRRRIRESLTTRHG